MPGTDAAADRRAMAELLRGSTTDQQQRMTALFGGTSPEKDTTEFPPEKSSEDHKH